MGGENAEFPDPRKNVVILKTILKNKKNSTSHWIEIEIKIELFILPFGTTGFTRVGFLSAYPIPQKILIPGYSEDKKSRIQGTLQKSTAKIATALGYPESPGFPDFSI